MGHIVDPGVGVSVGVCVTLSYVQNITFKNSYTNQAHNLKQRRINVDATASRRIDVDTTLFWRHVPAR